MSDQNKLTHALSLIREAVRLLKEHSPEDADLIAYQMTHVALNNPAALDAFLPPSVAASRAVDERASPAPADTDPKTQPSLERPHEQAQNEQAQTTHDPPTLNVSQALHNKSPLQRKRSESSLGIKRCGSVPFESLQDRLHDVDVTPAKRRAQKQDDLAQACQSAADC